jgi:hypothetical protein
MTRIPICLRDESLTALRSLAKQEYRYVPQQAAWIIEHELERRGFLVLEPFPPAVPIVPAEDSTKDGSYVTG